MFVNDLIGFLVDHCIAWYC